MDIKQDITKQELQERDSLTLLRRLSRDTEEGGTSPKLTKKSVCKLKKDSQYVSNILDLVLHRKELDLKVNYRQGPENGDRFKISFKSVGVVELFDITKSYYPDLTIEYLWENEMAFTLVTINFTKIKFLESILGLLKYNDEPGNYFTRVLSQEFKSSSPISIKKREDMFNILYSYKDNYLCNVIMNLVDGKNHPYTPCIAFMDFKKSVLNKEIDLRHYHPYFDSNKIRRHAKINGYASLLEKVGLL